MQLISPECVLSVWLSAALCICLGCGDDPTPTAPGNAVSLDESASSLDVDAELTADQLLAFAEEKLDAEKYEEAIKLFKRLVERSPTATNYASLGDCYWKQRELKQADVHYRQALAIDPKHCGANHALGRDAVLLKKYQDAVPYLDTANEVCVGTPVYAQNLRFRVEAMLQLDRIAEAESGMQKLRTEFPANPNTHEAGILLARKKGDNALAAEYQGKLDAITNGGPQTRKAEP